MHNTTHINIPTMKSKARPRKNLIDQVFSHENRGIFLILILLIVVVCVEVIIVDRAMVNFVSTNIVHSGSSSSSVTTIRKNGMRILNNINDKSMTEADNENNEVRSSMSMKSIKEILQESGISITKEEEILIPSIKDIEELYGSGPKIIGLETCKTFRESVPRSETLIGPAGLFNTGTNLIDLSLENNCYIPERMKKYGKMSLGMRKNVPWGKHNPVGFRGKHTAEQAGQANPNHLLPIVAIKDPYTWMASMCRHKYACKWNNSGKHCPGLVPMTPYEKGFHPGANSLPVRLRYISTNTTYYDSLVHLWNSWYTDWLQIKDFPKLIIRYEDLLFNLESVITTVCTCAGGKMRETFKTEDGSAKNMPGMAMHSGSSGLKDALLRYSNDTIRKHGYWKEDIDFAKLHLDETLMNTFGYHHL